MIDHPVPAEMAAWRSLGLCKGAANLFFPSENENATEAKKVCEKCPVRVPCLDWALVHNEIAGVWGGLSERERARIKRGQKRATNGSAA